MKRAIMVLLSLSIIGAFAFGAGQQGEAATEEVPTIKILSMNNWNFDPNENPMRQAVEEATGYKVEFAMAPQGQAGAEMVVLELSSGTSYDIIFNTNKSLYWDVAGKGALYELDALLEKYPILLRSQPDEVWKELEVNGHKYAVPSKRHPTSTYNAMWARTDYLAEAGVDKVPETLDEFVAALVAVKENTDYIPLSGRDSSLINWDSAHIMSGAFYVSSNWKDINGKLVPRLLQPGMKEFLAFLQELYSEGLIDEEFAANKRDQLHEKISSGKVVFSSFGWGDWQSLVSLEKTDPEATWEIMKPLAGPDGHREMNVGNLLSNRMCIIPRTSETAEESIKFLAKFAEPDAYTHIICGVEGEHYKVEGGEIVAINPKFANEREMSWWYMLVTPNDLQSKYFELGPKNEHPMVWRVFEPLQKNREWGVVDPTTFLSKPPAVAKYSRSLGQMEKDFYIQVVTGVKTLDDYEDFVKLWKSEGGQEMVDQLNEVYMKEK